MSKTMSTEEYIKNLALIMEQHKSEFDGKYVLIPENWEKFKKVHHYLIQFIKNNNGKLICCDVTPENMHGGLAVEIPMLDLYKTRLQEFKDILNLVDVFGITPLVSDAIRIDFSISYVWKAVPRK